MSSVIENQSLDAILIVLYTKTLTTAKDLNYMKLRMQTQKSESMVYTRSNN